MNKPIIVFTNFWDAEKLIKHKRFLFWRDESLYNVKLYDEKCNYTVYSIALAHPKLNKLPVIRAIHQESIPRLDFFCPTYEMLTNYKGGGSWKDYTTKYRRLLKSRKKEIVHWLKSLMPDRVYILCCWENTSKNARCHRQLLFDAFTQSKSLRDKAIFAYRDGSWNDNYVSTDIYKYLDNQVMGFSNAAIPVTVNSQDIASQLGVAVGDTIGTASSADGSWSLVVHPHHVQDALEELLYGYSPVSVSSQVQGTSTDDELP